MLKLPTDWSENNWWRFVNQLESPRTQGICSQWTLPFPVNFTAFVAKSNYFEFNQIEIGKLHDDIIKKVVLGAN